MSEPRIRTTRPIGRALKERWNIPNSLKATLMARIGTDQEFSAVFDHLMSAARGAPLLASLSEARF
jgi:hypothetical protein